MAALTIGTSAPDFDLPAIDGERYTLSRFAEAPYLAVIFSCNHCPYVRAWEDRLIAIQREYAGKGLRLVAINANDPVKYPDDSFEKMVQHAKEKGFNFPYLQDESQEVARAYGATRTPEIFLFDANRTLRYHGTVDDNYEDPNAVTQPYFRAALEALLAGQEPPTVDTAPVGCTIKWKNA